MKTFSSKHHIPVMGLVGLFLGLVVSGCDGILGIDGFKAGCIANTKRCAPYSPNWLQTCNAYGVWLDDHPCDIQEICESGKCIPECENGACPCAERDSRCVDNVPQTCVHGQWVKSRECIHQTCMGKGECEGVCAPGKRCLGNTPQECDATGHWKSLPTCADGEVCGGGSCTCVTGDRRCRNNQPEICNALNQWENLGDPCMGQTCVESTTSCEGVCEPEQKQCASANATQKCGPDGQWLPGESCPLGCAYGACVVCTIGDIRCAGNTPQFCDDNGQWIDQAPCIDKTCIAGACQGQCASGAARCAANYPQFCNSKGEWENNGPACGACVECNVLTDACSIDSIPNDSCTQPTTLTAGRFHTCALLPDQTLKCWGYNAAGRLGLGDTNDRGSNTGQMGANLPKLDLGAGLLVQDIRAGTSHTCARFTNGDIKCWGKNAFGQLGLGDTNNRGDDSNEMGALLSPVELGGVSAIAMTAGETHTCAILNNGNVKCWGGNFYGQLGLGDTLARGDQPGEMGANLPTVDLGNGATAARISAGDMHTCAQLSPVVVKCWGNNSFGQLGQGDTNHRSDQPNEMGANLPEVALDLAPGIIVNDISAGGTHSCVLLSDGSIKCWGNNAFGQLGQGDTKTRGDEINEMGTYLAPVKLGLSLGITVIGISAGSAHTCALLSNGTVKCWGKNDFGQLGLGDTNHRGDEMDEMGENLPIVNLGAGVIATEIHAGHSHTCALLSSGRVKCWGRSVYGQLGQSDTVTRGDERGDMGDKLNTVDL